MASSVLTIFDRNSLGLIAERSRTCRRRVFATDSNVASSNHKYMYIENATTIIRGIWVGDYMLYRSIE